MNLLTLIVGMLLLTAGTYAYGFELARSRERAWLWVVVASLGSVVVLVPALVRGCL